MMADKFKKMENNRPKPVVLVIMDGFGIGEKNNNNAIYLAGTPVLDKLMAEYPNTAIETSGRRVGLPDGQMGNSEVGHLNLGAGRVVEQDMVRIDDAIEKNTLKEMPKLKNFIEKTKKGTGVVHLTGLISDGGVHSHQGHITELAKIFSKNGLKVKLHLFTDGRDVPPESALGFINKLEKNLTGIKNVSIATVGGRYYAMDRDKRWDRVKFAYDAMVSAKGEKAQDAEAAVKNSYAIGKTDEFIMPTVIGDYQGMNSGDGLFMANYRSDRVQQFSTALLNPAFSGFLRDNEDGKRDFAAVLSMTAYSKELTELKDKNGNQLMPELFEPQTLKNTLPEIIAEKGFKQLHAAETEKFPHVTFFFNGGKEGMVAGEERILIPSPSVTTYNLKPEMSAKELTDRLVESINRPQEQRPDLVVVNYANGDMVGHTAKKDAVMKAVRAVDESVGRIYEAVTKAGGSMIVTADHGNAEELVDKNWNPHTQHTTNPVPLIIVDERLKGRDIRLPENMSLENVAPTVLQIMGVAKPKEMTGTSLLAGHNMNLCNDNKCNVR